MQMRRYRDETGQIALPATRRALYRSKIPARAGENCTSSTASLGGCTLFEGIDHMKLLFVSGSCLILLAGLATAASAQSESSYSRGYQDGYNDHFPSRMPSQYSGYRSGFQAGQDAADDDEDMERRRFDKFERDLWKQQSKDNPDLPAPEPTYTGAPDPDEDNQ